MTQRPRADDNGLMRMTSEKWWNGPWPWLVYLIFLPFPWIWVRPDTTTLGLTAAALVIFLPLYVFAHRSGGTKSVAASIAITAIGIALAPMPVGWTVFPIYGASVMGRVQPPRIAILGIAAIAGATAVSGGVLAQPLLWWLPGVLLIVMTGGATISREAFFARTRALLLTQEEVRRLAGTAERERITRDLHDVIGRTLTLVALKADLAKRLLDREPEAARSELDAIGIAARAGLAEVRAAIAGQSGGGLTQETSASMAALRTAGVEPTLTGDPTAVPGSAGAVLAMTLREAVTNVIRHADARHCEIALALDPDAVRLTVADDGIGLSFREGNGLSGMRQRLVAAGGSLRLSTSAPGTLLEARMPA